MAKVILEPIGPLRERFLPDEEWRAQRAHMGEMERALGSRRAEVRSGWGPKYEARVREKGKLPTWERIDADIKPFTSRRRELGDTVTLFVDRCVMCTRCVRFCREVTGTRELMVTNRGAHEEIDVVPGFPLANKLSGNVVDLCPVGALGDSDFLYSQRVWFMKSHDHVCDGCSTGCSIRVDENQDRIYRIKPRENPHVNHWWMCDDGRYGWKHVHDEHRIVGPRRRARDRDHYENVEWPAGRR